MAINQEDSKKLVRADVHEQFNSSPPSSPPGPATLMSPSVYEHSPGELEHKLARFAAGNNWFTSYQESQAGEQNLETPRRSSRPRQLFGTPSPLTSPGINSPTKLPNGKSTSAKKSAARSNKKRARTEATANSPVPLNVVEDVQMEPKSPSKRPYVELVNLDSSVSEVGENSVHERDPSILGSPDRSVEIHLELPPLPLRKYRSSSANTSMNDEDTKDESRDDENNRSLALSDVPLPATLPLTASLQATLPLSADPAATVPLSQGPTGTPSLTATLPLPSDSPYSFTPVATLPLPSDLPSSPATLPLPTNPYDAPPSPSPSPPNFSQFAPPVDTQNLSKVATQAAYDEDAFLAQFSSQFAKARKDRPASKVVTPPIAEDIDSEFDAQLESQQVGGSFLERSSTTLKSVLSAPNQPSFVDSLLESASRAATKKKSFYSVRPTDTSRHQTQKASRAFSGANWSAASYSLVDSSVTDFMVDSEDTFNPGLDEDRMMGVMTYDPDFDPPAELQVAPARFNRPKIIDDDEDYVPYDSNDPEGDFMQFGLNSQLPTQAMIRRKGNDRRATQQHNILMEIDDSEPLPKQGSAEDPIDDIDSSQEAVHLSTRVNPVDLEDELIREQYTPAPSQSYFRHPSNIQLPSFTQIDSSQSSRSRFMPPPAMPSMTQSPLPSSTQFASSQSQASGTSFRGILQPAKRVTASKASKKTKKRHTAERRFQHGLTASEEIEEEEVLQAPQGVNYSIMEGSVFDPNRSEAIEEFTAAEVRASAVVAAYEPYKLVAKAAGAIAPTETVANAPQRLPMPAQRHFVLPGSPASALASSAAGSVSWISKHCTPDWASSDPLARLAAENDITELQSLGRQAEISLLVILTSNVMLDSNHVATFTMMLSEEGDTTPPTCALFITRMAPNSAPLAAGMVLRSADVEAFTYGDGINVQWPYHKLNAPQQDSASVFAPIIIFGKEATLLPSAETALLVSGQSGLRQVREKFSSAVPIALPPTPPTPVLGNLTRTKMLSPSTASAATSRPFILPNALPSPSSAHVQSTAAAVATTFTRQRPFTMTHFYHNALGFVGHHIDANQQVLLLAVFARPFSKVHPSFKSSVPKTSALSLATQHFHQNWSQSVANLEECARIKRRTLYRRSTRPFSISSLQTSTSVSADTPMRTALAYAKNLKSLVWIDFDFEDAVPGATWTIKTSLLRQSTSVASFNMHTIVSDAISMFGVTKEEIAKSFAPEPRSRLTVNAKPLGSDTYFPSSQDSDMDVDQVPTVPSTHTQVSHAVFSCHIPKVTLSGKDCRALGASRSSDDRLLQLAPDDAFIRPRRVSLIGLVSSPVELAESSHRGLPQMLQCKIAFKGVGDILPTLLLPSYILKAEPFSDPVSIDHLLQIASDVFVADGYSHFTSMSAVDGVPGVRSLERCGASWQPKQLQCATGEIIKYKDAGKSARVPLASWKKKLLETPLMSSYDASLAGAWPSLTRSVQHPFTCPNQHTNLVLLPSTWNTELFSSVELPDRIGFCRSCFTTVTPNYAS